MSLPTPLRESLAAAAIAEGLADAIYTRLASPIGTLLLVQGRHGLARIAFEESAQDTVLAEAVKRLGPRVIASDAAMAATRDAIGGYLEGEPATSLDALALDYAWVGGPFRRAVLQTLRSDVARGSTIAYGALAARAGTPGAARAVGTAMALNPLPIVVPCHRVLPSTGRLGAYAGGVARKRALLALEGSLPAEA